MTGEHAAARRGWSSSAGAGRLSSNRERSPRTEWRLELCPSGAAGCCPVVRFLNPNKASSKRSFTPAFSNRRERYTLTVPSETIRVAAISLFFRPCESRLTNWPSRVVTTTRRAFSKLSVRAFSNDTSRRLVLTTREGQLVSLLSQG